jgi:hypothetical protein
MAQLTVVNVLGSVKILGATSAESSPEEFPNAPPDNMEPRLYFSRDQGVPPFDGNRNGDASDKTGTAKVGPQIKSASVKIVTPNGKNPGSGERNAQSIQGGNPLPDAAGVVKLRTSLSRLRSPTDQGIQKRAVTFMVSDKTPNDSTNGAVHPPGWWVAQVQLAANPKHNFRNPSRISALGDREGDFTNQRPPISGGGKVDSAVRHSLKDSRGNVGAGMIRNRSKAKLPHHSKNFTHSNVGLGKRRESACPEGHT